jgi:hypothetical protein
VAASFSQISYEGKRFMSLLSLTGRNNEKQVHFHDCHNGGLSLYFVWILLLHEILITVRNMFVDRTFSEVIYCWETCTCTCNLCRQVLDSSCVIGTHNVLQIITKSALVGLGLIKFVPYKDSYSYVRTLHTKYMLYSYKSFIFDPTATFKKISSSIWLQRMFYPQTCFLL